MAATKSISRSTGSVGKNIVIENTEKAPKRRPHSHQLEKWVRAGWLKAPKKGPSARQMDAVDHRRQKPSEIDPQDEREESHQAQSAEALPARDQTPPKTAAASSASPAARRREIS